MAHESTSELSLRHLPDLSDASLSFQIPADISTTDFLLSDNTTGFDFLRGAGDDASFATCAPTPKVAPLTLSQLTPRAERSPRSSPRSPSPGSSSNPSKDIEPRRLGLPSPSKARKLASGMVPPRSTDCEEPAVSEERIESLRARMETLDDDCDSSSHVRFPEPAQHGNTARPKPLSQSLTNANIKPRVKTKPTVTGGGIVKPASKLPISSNKSKTNVSSRSATQSTSAQLSASHIAAEDIVPPVNVVADTSFGSDANQSTRLSTGGVAERLVLYSQKLISSIGLYRSRSENPFEEGSSAARTDTCARVEETQPSLSPSSASPSPPPPTVPIGNHDTFRLSEISPRKGEEGPNSLSGCMSFGSARQMSPMRPGRKRPGADDEERQDHQRKKGKTVLPSAEFECGSSETGTASNHVLQPSAHKNHGLALVSTSRSTRFPTSNFPNARTKYKAKPNPHTEGLTAQSNPSSSSLDRNLGTSRQGKSRDVEGKTSFPTNRFISSLSKSSGTSRPRLGAERKKKPPVGQVQERPGQSKAGHMSLFEKPAVTLPPANPTKPVAFTFRVDARIEARRAEFEERQATIEQERAARMHPQAVPVPDFRALHLAHQASVACRKANIVPIVPTAPIELSTEQRAREREKFDEMMRQKAEEIERVKEERRKQQEAEEEREIKELRKRAIPKAHEVPEWYADVPKRKGGSVKG
ncbi:hypothetical protein BV22DRAFT_1130357 [Leucogyrophana mollusca]|uniref:Uncharacterized protein n=1 Tax=Leucogyrophana mollusca TaxID=85980 RepID=A0ACB8BGW9_9AGAM|nr:hypothetical protein BV22DRAFT_1130357 [Leucogyrophana mollusca]